MEATLLRAPGQLFQQTAEGRIENIYTLKLINKTARDIPVRLKLENLEGRLTVMGGRDLVVPREQLVSAVVLIDLEPGQLNGATTKLRIGVYSKDKLLQTVNTGFVGPRDGAGGAARD